MGLIVDAPIADVTTPVVEVIAPIVYVRACTDGSSSSGITDSKSFDKSIYRILSMQDDMKTLQEPVRARNEFDLFVVYAEAKTDGTPYDHRFDQLDAYLGTIGISNEMC